MVVPTATTIHKRASGKSVGEASIRRKRSLVTKGRPAGTARLLERLEKPGLKEFAQLSSSFELWDGIQFLEGRGERVGKTPDRSRPEFLILRLEVEIMHGAGKMFGSLQFALDKRLVDDDFRGDVYQFAPLPGLHLLAHGIEVPLHPVNTD